MGLEAFGLCLWSVDFLPFGGVARNVTNAELQLVLQMRRVRTQLGEVRVPRLTTGNEVR